MAYPTIQVEIVPPTVDGPDPFISTEDEEAAWEPCISDNEDETRDFEYHYFENEQNLTVQKFKRRKPLLERSEADGGAVEHIPMFPAKEPVLYRENMVYHQNNGDYRPAGDDFVTY